MQLDFATTRNKYAIYLIVFVAAFSGLLFIISEVNAKVANDDQIVFTDPAKPIIVKRSNPVFTIVLQSNPTTGFSWLLKGYNANLISPVRHKFYPPAQTKPILVGAPGYEKWTFRVKSNAFVVPHTTNITMVYTRAWEDQVSASQLTNFKVVTSNVD